MTRKKDDFENDDYQAFKLEGTLEQRVRAWSKYASFNHVGPVCTKCGKASYAFTIEDVDGFCVNCFNKRWPHPVRDSVKKQKEDAMPGMKDAEK